MTVECASREAVANTVVDGWRLGCDCLYLFLAWQPKGSPTTVIVPTHATKPMVCPRYHGDVEPVSLETPEAPGKNRGPRRRRTTS